MGRKMYLFASDWCHRNAVLFMIWIVCGAYGWLTENQRQKEDFRGGIIMMKTKTADVPKQVSTVLVSVFAPLL